MSQPWSSFNARTIELYCVVIFEIIFLFMYFQAFTAGNTYHSYVILYSMVLILVPPVAEWKMNLSLPLGLKIVVPLALLFNAGGGIVKWYMGIIPVRSYGPCHDWCGGRTYCIQVLYLP